LAIGQGERYISNLFSNQSDPGMSAVLRICAALNITPNALVGLGDQMSLARCEGDNQLVNAHAERILSAVTNEAHRRLRARGVRPSFDEVLLWWHQQNGLLSNFEQLASHMDLFVPPKLEDLRPDPYQLGHQSLITTAFGVEDAEHLRMLQKSFGEQLCEKVAFAHVETDKGKPVLSIEQINVSLPGRSFPARFEYKRLLLPVHDGKGNRFVLNYSQALE
jgi:hypothetical protein